MATDPASEYLIDSIVTLALSIIIVSVLGMQILSERALQVCVCVRERERERERESLCVCVYVCVCGVVVCVCCVLCVLCVVL